jgi:hypothetical protein
LTVEYVGNLHNHTVYSDGHGTHQDLARAALQAGLDFVIATDHNLWIDGLDGYRYLGDRRVLLLTGEEVHDQSRQPQKNHLLIYEARAELAPHASDPQGLIDAAKQAGGLSFIAHPVDPAAPAVHEPDLSWVNWEVDGYTGIEIWNFMTEFKSRLRSIPAAIYYAYRPERIAVAPFEETLKLWDRLLARRAPVVAIGGADAHALPARLGPLRRTLFPYAFHFRGVNTHVLLSEEWSGDVLADRKRLFQAIRRGHCFVANDLLGSAAGFRFTASSDAGEALMGDSLKRLFGATLRIRLPRRAEISLLRDGQLEAHWPLSDTAVHNIKHPGIFRVEVHRRAFGRRCGWIYSNPIIIRD